MRDFDERLMKAETSDEVKKLKLWMFQEQVKIQAKKDELDELSHKLQEEKKAVNNQRNDVSIRIEINTGALENIKTNLNKLVTTEEKYKWVNALAQTANGNINGKSKIALETYVQISYFERIINRANLRFMKMTNGQYELKRSTESDDFVCADWWSCLNRYRSCLLF